MVACPRLKHLTLIGVIGRPGHQVHPQRGKARGSCGGQHALVNLRRRQQRVLRAIERDLSDSDPGLYAFFSLFAGRTGGCDLRWVEEIDRRRLWPWRRGERRRSERMRDWYAEHWNDP
jgi:hypothetical protein